MIGHVALTGGISLIGTPLTQAIQAGGGRVSHLGRLQDVKALRDLDAVVHLGGISFSRGRRGPEFTQALRSSRVDETARLAQIIAELPQKPPVFVLGSSTYLYGNTGDAVVSDAAAAGSGFLPDLLSDAEASLAPLLDAGVRVVSARVGTVLSPSAGYLQQLLLPFRFRLGGRLGSGRQYVPWITPRDAASALLHLVRSAELMGPINVVAPSPVTNHELVQLIGEILHRPPLLPLPVFALKWVFGAELVEDTLLAGVRALPKALLADGFTFTDTDLESTLRALLPASR